LEPPPELLGGYHSDVFLPEAAPDRDRGRQPYLLPLWIILRPGKVEALHHKHTDAQNLGGVVGRVGRVAYNRSKHRLIVLTIQIRIYPNGDIRRAHQFLRRARSVRNRAKHRVVGARDAPLGVYCGIDVVVGVALQEVGFRV